METTIDKTEVVAETTGPKPSIGRIVIYNHRGSENGPGLKSPAMIQKVHDNGAVDLYIFGPSEIKKGGPYHLGNGPCQWNWPPRV